MEVDILTEMSSTRLLRTTEFKLIRTKPINFMPVLILIEMDKLVMMNS